jgi:hypothetical protein
VLAVVKEMGLWTDLCVLLCCVYVCQLMVLTVAANAVQALTLSIIRRLLPAAAANQSECFLASFMII